MLLAIAIASLLIWLYLAVGHGGFWKIQNFILRRISPSADAPFVVAVVPARDEADVIAPCITSLLTQTGVRIHIFLVDDSSEDGTAAVALRAAEAAGKADQLTKIRALPPPAGWSGKLWAVQHGVENALRLNPD